MRVLTIFGTRPEAIKLAPVIRELQKRSHVDTLNVQRSNVQRVTVKVCVTAQHRQMLDQVLRLFNITPDYDLNVMEDNQTPTQVASAVLARLEPIVVGTLARSTFKRGTCNARVKVGHVAPRQARGASQRQGSASTTSGDPSPLIDQGFRSAKSEMPNLC